MNFQSLNYELSQDQNYNQNNQTWTQYAIELLVQVLLTVVLFIKQSMYRIFLFIFTTLHSKECVLSDYQMVRKFTKAAGTECSSKPTVITKERGVFLIRHALSELHEFALTITGSTEEAYKLLQDSLSERVDTTEWKQRTELELIEDQEDAICDTWVYMLNVASEFGQDVSSMMKVVMKANMAKIDSRTGKCIRRDDGKIMKPEGWTPPNTKEEIARQLSEGTD